MVHLKNKSDHVKWDLVVSGACFRWPNLDQLCSNQSISFCRYIVLSVYWSLTDESRDLKPFYLLQNIAFA